MNRVNINMAVHNTPENDRLKYTEQCINSLIKQGVHLFHDLYIINQGTCEKTKEYLNRLPFQCNVIFNTENKGTARAINQGLENRKPGQHAIKCDDDVVIKADDWVEQMAEAIEREPQIGIVGLKRKDLIQTTWHSDPEYRSELIMLPHEPGQRWINVEKTRDIMGTCTMFNSALLDKIGYLYQNSIYGFDDCYASWRSNIAGFWNVHLSHIEIEHLDDGGNLDYTTWKQKHSGEVFEQVRREVNEMLRGERSIYVDFY